MKIKVKDIEDKPKEKVFYPFVLELLIEDERDIEDLVARFNLAKRTVDDINKEIGCDCKATIPYDWGVFNKLFREKPYMK